MNNVPQVIAQALAAFTPPPCLVCGNAYLLRGHIWCDCGRLGTPKIAGRVPKREGDYWVYEDVDLSKVDVDAIPDFTMEINVPPESVVHQYRCAKCGGGLIINDVCVTCRAPFDPSAPDPVQPSLIIACPACDGGWRDTASGVVMCGQCRGTGVRATAGGEA